MKKLSLCFALICFISFRVARVACGALKYYIYDYTNNIAFITLAPLNVRDSEEKLPLELRL